MDLRDGVYIAALLIQIIGWAVVHFLNNVRESKNEQRRETRHFLEKNLGSLEELKEDILDLRTSENFSDDLRTLIHQKIERIEISLANLNLLDQQKLTDSIIRIRKSIESDGGEKSNFVKLVRNDPIL